jgi:indolepyruvate ferredoxin oxidoreductase alpha subunit
MITTHQDELVLLSGDEALARGAWEAGLRVAAAYPGTPSTEILEALATYDEIDSQWSVNEKVAYEVALGASIGGLRSLYASKHVGVNVAMDPLMTSAYTGVGAGFVLAVCDDPGLHSSQNEQDSRLVAAFAKIPLLEPSTPSEAKAWIADAFALSEEFDLPVMIRMTTRLAHSKEDVVVGPRREVEPRAFKIDIPKYVMVPRFAYRKHIELEDKLVRLASAADRSPLNRIEKGSPALGIVTAGVPYLHAREMCPDASILKLGFTHPFPEKLVRDFAATVKELRVIEELEPYMEERLRIMGLPVTLRPRSWRVGELRPEDIPEIIAGREKVEKPVTTRKPVLCPGCPHRWVFHVLKKLKLVVSGDIGCYTLAAAPPQESMHTCVCMGASITLFEGLRKSLGKKVVAVIGDSTFVHTGIAGLVNLAYNGATGVVVILDNGTTAMTGNQPHPATGETIRGEKTKQLAIEEIARAAGADRVEIVDPHALKSLEKILRERLAADELTVIIARAPCKLIDRWRAPAPERRPELCSGCHLCVKIDCPALRVLPDGSIEIDAEYCAGCALCAEVCNRGAIVRRPKEERGE